MPHHALQLHVERLGGGLHVAVDVDLHRAVLPSRDHRRRVAPFLHLAGFAPCRHWSRCAVRTRSPPAESAGSSARPGAVTTRDAASVSATDFSRYRGASRNQALAADRISSSLLRVLRPDPRHQDEAGAQRADNRAERVRRVDAARPGAPDRRPASRRPRARAESSRPTKASAAESPTGTRTMSSWNVYQLLGLRFGSTGQ